jgi:hypothetical protein
MLNGETDHHERPPSMTVFEVCSYGPLLGPSQIRIFLSNWFFGKLSAFNSHTRTPEFWVHKVMSDVIFHRNLGVSGQLSRKFHFTLMTDMAEGQEKI